MFYYSIVSALLSMLIRIIVRFVATHLEHSFGNTKQNHMPKVSPVRIWHFYNQYGGQWGQLDQFGQLGKVG
jgi:hypothetical protein